MGPLRRFSNAVDRLNDRIGSAIQWLTLVMVVIGAFNAIARYTDQYTSLSLSSNAYLELQWYLFSLVFLMGAAYGLNHDYTFVWTCCTSAWDAGAAPGSTWRGRSFFWSPSPW